MAVDLTTSITKTANYQGITKMEFVVPHIIDPQDTTSMIINKGDVMVVFHVTTWDEDGVELYTERHHEYLGAWSQLFKDDVKAVYSRLEQFAISQGLLGDGTAEVLE